MCNSKTEGKKTETEKEIDYQYMTKYKALQQIQNQSIKSYNFYDWSYKTPPTHQ